jgi:hypothetical protein
MDRETREKRETEFADIHPISISAYSGEGIEELKKLL